MKKAAFLILLVLVVSPAWAIFCQSCGFSMADEARFCAQCGRQRGVPRAEQPSAPVQVRVPDPVPVVEEYSGAYLVQSPYFPVDGYRIQRGQPIWILESGERGVRIRYRHPSSCGDSITSWISAGDLECHTSWRRHRYNVVPVVGCDSPRVTTRILIGDVGFCWPQPRHRHYGGHHGYSHSGSHCGSNSGYHSRGRSHGRH